MTRDTKTKRYAEEIERAASSDYASRLVGSPAGNLVSIAADGDTADSGYTATDFADATAILGDASGRQLRQIQITIEDGTNANTLKITVVSLFDGDAIATTDNVAKGATTGNFTLDAAGEVLTIEAAGLTGNAVMNHSVLEKDTSNTSDPTLEVHVVANDLTFQIESNGVNQDLTSLTDVGGFTSIIIVCMYLTDA